MSDFDTIAALATAPAPAGIAVLRLSGPGTRAVLDKVFRAKQRCSENPRQLIYGDFVDPDSAANLDSGMAVYMPAPNSYTGEDLAELHTHGSPLIVEKILDVLHRCGARAAEAGEFTKRAFLNGKLDLVQAEAVADLIVSASEASLRMAREQLDGRFSLALDALGEPLRNVLAEIEASIDFPEEDIQPDTLEKIERSIAQALTQIDKLLSTYRYGQAVKEGYRVLLCGPPNAGKSSLLNALLGSERAIVTDISGTTRDLIEESADMDGFRFLFCDSAGLHNKSEDRVEQIGIELARERISWANLVLIVLDASRPVDPDITALIDEVHQRAENLWIVANKLDLNPDLGQVEELASTKDIPLIGLSALERSSCQELILQLIDQVKSQLSSDSEQSIIVTNARQRASLVDAQLSLKQTLQALGDRLPLEVISAELRVALSALDEIVGKTYTEDILGRIFSKFCVGK